MTLRLFLLALLPSLSLAQPLLIDELVAVIDLGDSSAPRSILLSEVELEARLWRAQAQGGATLDRPLEDRARAEALERLVNELIVVSEAERLEVFRLKPEEEVAVLDAFEQAVGAQTLRAWLVRRQVPLWELNRSVLRHARAERYLEGRFRLAARPRPSQIQAAWEQSEEREPFELVKTKIAAELEARRYKELVERFVADMRRRSRVKLLRDFSESGRDTAMHGQIRAMSGGIE